MTASSAKKKATMHLEPGPGMSASRAAGRPIWVTDSLTTSKPVLAANRGSVAALWDLAEGLLEGWSRPDRHDSQ